MQYYCFREDKWPWIYVSHGHQFLYCQTPKVGSTNWLRVLSLLEGGKNDDDVKSIYNFPIPLLSYLDETEQEKVLLNYRKFMVIRDPFERILSAYKSKFLPFKNFSVPLFSELSRKIIQHYRSSKSLSKQIYPTFEEFVKFVIDESKSIKIQSHYSEPRHWLPQNELCYPCDIDYDFILKMDEILNIESDFILDALGVPFNIRYPKKDSFQNYYHTTQANVTEMKQYFSQVNPKHLNALYHYYEKDYKIFGADLLF